MSKHWDRPRRPHEEGPGCPFALLLIPHSLILHVWKRHWRKP